MNTHPNDGPWLPERKTLDRGRIAEQIGDELRERILDGALARGAKLPTEKELANAYGVSGATVREALRALVSTHMIEVRHGSGAYVTANAEQLIAQSLQSMIQLEKVGINDTFGVLSVLNVYGAELAASRATPEDLAELESALLAIESAKVPTDLEVGLKRFMFALAMSSHNHLLIAICKFLAGLHVGMTRKISAQSDATWQGIRLRLREDRRRLVDAIAAGDAGIARTTAMVFHEHAVHAVGGAVAEESGAKAKLKTNAKLSAEIITKPTSKPTGKTTSKPSLNTKA